MNKFFGHHKNKTKAKNHAVEEQGSSPSRRKSGDGEGRVNRVNIWWHHHYSGSIANPLLYEPLLAPSESLTGMLSQEDQDDVDALLASFTASTAEDISVMEQILHSVSPEDQSFNDEGLTLLHLAAKKGFQQSLELLLHHSINSWMTVQNIACTRNGHTPLHLAAMYGFEHCVHTLLNAKADPTIQNFAMKTALHYASAFGYCACVNAILNHTLGRWKPTSTTRPNKEKVLLNMQDNYGHTALHLAAIDGNVAVVRILLEAHASVALVDDEQRSALSIAQTLAEGSGSPEHMEMVQLLRMARGTGVSTATAASAAASSPIAHSQTHSQTSNREEISPPSSLLFEGMSFPPHPHPYPSSSPCQPRPLLLPLSLSCLMAWQYTRPPLPFLPCPLPCPLLCLCLPPIRVVCLRGTVA